MPVIETVIKIVANFTYQFLVVAWKPEMLILKTKIQVQKFDLDLLEEIQSVVLI